MSYAIGLTGQIASGKSTVAGIFQEFNIPVVSADLIARELIEPGKPAYKAVVEHFGEHILHADKTVNRQKLRQLIFNNHVEKTWLETLLHPLIREKMAQRVNQLTAPYCLVEIPLLKNRSEYPYLNRILLIVSDENTQIQRAVQRDNSTRENVSKILQSQLSNQELKQLSDDTLVNDNSLSSLKTACEKLHISYLAKAATAKTN